MLGAAWPEGAPQQIPARRWKDSSLREGLTYVIHVFNNAIYRFWSNIDITVNQVQSVVINLAC